MSGPTSNLTDISGKIKDMTAALAKADSELKWELAGTAADVAGMVDPTPASDLIGAGLSLRKGDFLGAGLSVASMVPYLGDALAKPVKGVRAAKAVVALEKKIAMIGKQLADLKAMLRKAEEAEAAATAAAAAAKNADEVAAAAKAAARKAEAPAAKSVAEGQQAAVKGGKGKDCKDCGKGLKTVTETVGRNTATWTVDAAGKPIAVKGTLRESFSGAKRSGSEVKAQVDSAASGVAGDQGGHAIGHRFMKDQGSKNLFPQEGNFNMSAFKTLENDYARYTAKGYKVDFSHKLGDFDPVTGRPGSVSVNFEVTDAKGNLIDTFADKFLNKAGQTYTRRAF